MNWDEWSPVVVMPPSKRRIERRLAESCLPDQRFDTGEGVVREHSADDLDRHFVSSNEGCDENDSALHCWKFVEMASASEEQYVVLFRFVTDTLNDGRPIGGCQVGEH